ncbi:MAG TPA: DUF3048 domain-containing protein [bacterium]|nr:DUF3048 domain-containing protein [bacterium]
MRPSVTGEIRVLVSLGFLLAGGLFAGVLAVGTESAPVAPPVLHAVAVPAEEERPPISTLVDDPVSGQSVPRAQADRRPIAVMIDNYPDARPQWGLSFASRIYEALTEGGITRYLAIFGPDDADRVGPVRSARTQFLGYALELHAAIAHVGGNEDALDRIVALHVVNLDQFRNAEAYRRIFRPRVALEHTMFTSTRALRAAAEHIAWPPDLSIARPLWKAEVPLDQRPAAQRVSVDFSSPPYKVTWVYRRATNDYERILAGAQDVDAATGRPLTAKSIAIAVITRTHGRTQIGEDTWTFADVGSGEAWVVQDGTATPARWEKASVRDRLRFLDETGHEIALDRGPQWVEIVPPEVEPDIQ